MQINRGVISASRKGGFKKKDEGSGRDEMMKVFDGSQATSQDLLLIIKGKRTGGEGMGAVEGDLFLAEVAEGLARADEEEL